MPNVAVIVLTTVAFALSSQASAETQPGVQPAAQTDVLTTNTNGFQQKIEADITGSQDLYLVVTDGGNGFSCDWADWIHPRLTGPKGELRLTSLKWKSAQADWGRVAVNRNAGGGKLRVDDRPVDDGIGTHANSVIHYEIPAGYTRFSAIAALDNGGTDQGSSASAQFAVYTKKPDVSGSRSDTKRTPDTAVAGLDVADGLTVTLAASEPMMSSPSNIDVDHLGRVWVCEVVNYRHFANPNNPAREAGDRILVLEDTDGDGKMDRETTFYQGHDIDSAHGVCVLGNRVIVSAGENVFNFYDDNGDLKADRKELMFTGIAGTQHDHGIHSFTFGPDGRLYFNFGNAGKHLYDANGSPIVDVAGNQISDARQPYQEGMAFRCELDGSQVDTIGWNFRNNWELCVDSFGTVWQSDNDDDGNRGVRINYVMEYGNYGYRDEFTGAGWREPRTGWSSEIPLRHWHLNDPGVVPNLLQTGAGSPTGIICYEGSLLPEPFRNQLIHCDAGPNVVRSYLVEDDGAGYSAEIRNLLEGARDQWFRPSDVCVAPDGSVFVADWYDPGVGGHRQGDIERGRLFRLAPEDSSYRIEKPDLETIDGAAAALLSPNVATRYLAYQKLRSAGADAEAALRKIFTTNTNPRFRARAFWLLAGLDDRGADYIQAAAKDSDSNIRITALRAARRTDTDIEYLLSQLSDDSSVQVRRECLLALRHLDSHDKPKIWAQLARQLPSHDRWYLEALGIAADGDWNRCLKAFTEQDNVTPEAIASVLWRSRADSSAAELVRQIELLAKSETAKSSPQHLLMFFRALDFQPHQAVSQSVPGLLNSEVLDSLPSETAPIVIAESLQRLGKDALSSSPEARQALNRALSDLKGTTQYITLIEKFRLTDRYPDVLALAQEHPNEQIGVEAIQSLLRAKQWKLLTAALKDDNTEKAIATALVMGNSLDGNIGGVLLGVIQDDSVDLAVRRQAVSSAAKINYAAKELAARYEKGGLNTELTQTLAAALHAAPSRATREIASRLFPLPAAKEGKPLPPIRQLVTRKGDPANGRLIFNTTGTCHKCHKVNKIGHDVGPDLSEIGSKLSRQAMFESIIFPSAGISHNYEAYTFVLTSGTTVTGLITSESADRVTIRGVDAINRVIATEDIDERVKQKISLMPADLQKIMTVQEMVDVVEYLMTLRKKDASGS